MTKRNILTAEQLRELRRIRSLLTKLAETVGYKTKNFKCIDKILDKLDKLEEENLA